MLIAILISGVIVSVLIVVYFYFKNRILKEQHHTQVRTLEENISTHLNNIIYRNNGLSVYDFLKYNLDESLLVQHSIKD
jgi:cell division protein FtsL